MTTYSTQKFPKSRIATIDVCEIGKRKHHITGLIELDVTASRKKIRAYNVNNKIRISFNAWIISVISRTLCQHKTVSSYLKGKRKRVIFDDIHVSLIVEKELNGQRVPIPLLIEKANAAGMEDITAQINNAKNKTLTARDIVLQKKADRLERMYYSLPGFLRRLFWKYLLRHPQLAYKKMGNVAITSIGMIGRIKGWFIPVSIHPVCFGLSSITKKPVVDDDRIEIREILNMSVLLDHDVVDGAPMARFLQDLSVNIEQGYLLP